jgi:hypothetical protein
MADFVRYGVLQYTAIPSVRLGQVAQRRVKRHVGSGVAVMAARFQFAEFVQRRLMFTTWTATL